MIFVLILLIAVALAFFVSPLIAIVLFIVGAAGFLALIGMKRTSEGGGNASADPGSHAAQRFRRKGRETPVR